MVTVRRPGKCTALVAACLFGLAAAAAHADVIPVVSAKSSLDHLSRRALSDIFLGRNSLGPDGQPVVPIDQADGSSARDEFYASFVGKTPAQLRAHWSKIIFTGRGMPPRAAGDGAAARRLLADNPYAIGYLDASELDSTVKPLKVD